MALTVAVPALFGDASDAGAAAGVFFVGFIGLLVLWAHADDRKNRKRQRDEEAQQALLTDPSYRAFLSQVGADVDTRTARGEEGGPFDKGVAEVRDWLEWQGIGLPDDLIRNGLRHAVEVSRHGRLAEGRRRLAAMASVQAGVAALAAHRAARDPYVTTPWTGADHA